jgi:hypothetical protein
MNKKASVELIALGIVAILALGGLVWISGTSATGQYASTSVTCTETDGGIKYMLKGTVNYAKGSVDDTCLSFGKAVSSGPDLLELYCTSLGGLGRLTYTCPKGCVDGACI